MRRLNVLVHHGVDLRGPLLAAEHTVVAHTRLQVMRFHVIGQRAAKVLSSQGLTEAANVISLTLNGQEVGALDGLRVHRCVFVGHEAPWERVLLKDGFHGFDVELAGQVHDCKIFFVEIGNLIRLMVFGATPKVIELFERLFVTLNVHA